MNVRSIINRHAGILTPLLFLLFSSAFCSPLFENLYLSGRDDWDYFSFWYEIPAISLFGYHQLPLWNPYSCGGMPFIGNPQAGFPSPIFVLTSVFGVLAGLKMAIWLHTFLGLWGTWIVAGHLGIRGPARMAPPLIFMLSSAWAIHATAGQLVWLPAAFLPFFFLAFLKGETEGPRWLVLAGLLESLMFYEGGTYVLGFSLLFVGVYALFSSIEKRTAGPLGSFVAVNLCAAVLSAPKLLPVLDLLHRYPRLSSADDGNAPAWDTYLSYLIDRFHSVNTGSVDIASYLGLTVVLLYLCSLSLIRKKPALVMASLFMLAVSFGNFGSASPWSILHRLPFFASFHEGPCRSLVVLGFSVALLVGVYLESTHRDSRRRDLLIVALVISAFAEFSPWRLSPTASFPDSVRHLAPAHLWAAAALMLLIGVAMTGEATGESRRWALIGLVVFFIGADLFLNSFPILQEASMPSNMFPAAAPFDPSHKYSPTFVPQLYRVPPALSTTIWNPKPAARLPFSQVRIEGLDRNVHGAWSDQYLPLLRNSGVVSAYETLPVERSPRAVTDPGYLGEFRLLSGGEAVQRSWSPNRLTYHLRTPTANRLVVNQNFWRGWRASVGVVVSHNGLLAVDLPPGEYDLTLTYLPTSFVAGLAVLAAGTLLMALFVRRRNRDRR